MASLLKAPLRSEQYSVVRSAVDESEKGQQCWNWILFEATVNTTVL